MKDELKQQILDLRGKLTGNMMEDMEIRDRIHNLEMELNGVKPTNGNIDCVGCGSWFIIFKAHRQTVFSQKMRFFFAPVFELKWKTGGMKGSFSLLDHPEKTIAINKSNFWEYLE